METLGTPPPYTAQLVGFQFRFREDKAAFADAAHVGMELSLSRDRDNEYDLYAVRVYFNDDRDRTDEDYGAEPYVPVTRWIGFLNRETSMWVAQWIDAGLTFRCTLTSLDAHNKHELSIEPVAKLEVPELTPADRTEALAASSDDDIPF